MCTASTFFNRGPTTNPTDPQIAVTNVASDVVYRLPLRQPISSNILSEEAGATTNAALLAFGGANVFVFNSQICPRQYLVIFSFSFEPAVCERGCGNGVCTSYNTCSCNMGYSGATCETRLIIFGF
jgi:hypothetical protein